MQIREYSLPIGWYPRNIEEISRFLAEFPCSRPFSHAVIVPHAGWYYSGRLAALGISALKPDVDTVIVIGGHLPAGSRALFAMEDAVRTPFDPMLIDAELRGFLLKKLGGVEDRFRDNTVEVLLPMVRYYFPKAQLLWMRLPSDIESFEAGKVISEAAVNLNRKVNVITSNDLTHYGSNYGFAPKGRGEAALRWVREVNDAGFIRAVETGNNEEVLKRAEIDHAACSAGAVLGVMGFAQAEGLPGAQLLKYATSADVTGETSPDSFVGYAAMVF